MDSERTHSTPKAYADLGRTVERDPRLDPWPGDVWCLHGTGEANLDGKLARLEDALLLDLTYVVYPVVALSNGKEARFPMDIRDPQMAAEWAQWTFHAPSARRAGPPPFGATLFDAHVDALPGVFPGEFHHPKGESPPDPLDALPSWQVLLREAFAELPEVEDPTPADVWAVLESLARDAARRQRTADTDRAKELAKELAQARVTLRELRAVVTQQHQQARETADALRRAEHIRHERNTLREQLDLANSTIEALQKRVRELGDQPAPKVTAPPSTEAVLREVLTLLHPDVCQHPRATEVTARVNALRDSIRRY